MLSRCVLQIISEADASKNNVISQACYVLASFLVQLHLKNHHETIILATQSLTIVSSALPPPLIVWAEGFLPQKYFLLIVPVVVPFFLISKIAL